MPMLDDALGVLLDDEHASIVELALCARDGLIEAHARRGSCAFDRDGRVAWVRGDDPLARRDAAAFSPLERELADPRPPPERNSYPFAHEHVAHLFDDPRAPDIAVVHTGAHNWEDRGGHRGEHGSLGVIQSRAPLVLAGAGARSRGRIEAAARMVDVAPTIAALLGLDLPGHEGRALDEALDGARARRVAAFLLDGTNANVAYAMAAAGELPALAGLMERGTTFGHGLIASFPSVTLANHATALTGLHPGHHGILHNFYFDRVAGRAIVTNAPEVWHLARDEMRADVETLFEVAARRGWATAAVNEPVDRGAGYATFDALRSGSVAHVAAALPPVAEVPGATTAFVEQDPRYGWSASADHLAVEQAAGLLAEGPSPRLLWVNLVLPDAANHIGGPYSEMGMAGLRETDARLGRILAALGDDGETAFVVLADHGMEESDPACTGDWGPALARAGITFRDEGAGFLYLGT